jgi:hypothetical protein
VIQHSSTNLGCKADVKLLHAVGCRQIVSSPNTLYKLHLTQQSL